MSSPSTSEDIFSLSSHYSLRMQPYALHAPLGGIGPFSAFFLLREPHTDFADSRRNHPPTESIRLRPSLIPLDARAGFCPWKRFFGPSDGLSSFWGIVVAIRFAPCRRGRQGFDFQAMTSTEIKKRPGDVIVFRPGFIRPTATSQGGPQAIHRPQAIGDPLSGPSKIKTGSGLWWTI